jgi:hypothetical protein
LFVHPPTASPTAAREQVGCSDAYIAILKKAAAGECEFSSGWYRNDAREIEFLKRTCGDLQKQTRAAILQMRPTEAIPGAVTTAKEVNPQPSSNPQQVAPPTIPPVPPQPLPEEALATSGNQPPSASDTAAPESKTPESTSVPQSGQATQSEAAESGKAEPSSPGFLATIGSGISSLFGVLLWIVILLYVSWGTYCGCKLVYPQMLAWYESRTWFIIGKGPIDILLSQVAFGLQVRFWAIVLGIIVGCLGGAVYMQFFRPTQVHQAIVQCEPRRANGRIGGFSLLVIALAFLLVAIVAVVGLYYLLTH